MKIERLLVQHFYHTKQVTLQGIGTFVLSPDFVLPTEVDKDIVIPENAISFTYNNRTVEDEALIDFIVQQTHKIKPLASADLDSYLLLGKQFLNIGKPFRIEGLGWLEKNQQGEFEFKQGYAFHPKAEEIPITLKEKINSDDEISFVAEKINSSPNKKKIVLITVIVVVAGLAGYAAWYFFMKKHNAPAPPAPINNTKTDTVKTTTLYTDSLDTKLPVLSDSNYTFKVVFRETTHQAIALERMNTLKLRGHKVIMYTKDSILYKLAEPFTLPLSDTTRVKDSLNKYYYQGKAYIEIN